MTPEEINFEELARDSFKPKKNKNGETYTQLVGQNPNGWRKHVTSFKAGYYKAMQEFPRQVEVKPNISGGWDKESNSITDDKTVQIKDDEKIEAIKNRIIAEYEKHPEIDWPGLAAQKIYIALCNGEVNPGVSDAVEFAAWITDNGWVDIYSEELSKRAYVNTSNNQVLAHGSDYHYTKLIKEAGKTIEQLYEQFRNEAKKYIGGGMRKTERHTRKDADYCLWYIKKNVCSNAKLIGSFGKGLNESKKDIDIYLPDIEFTQELKDKLFTLLDAKNVESTDWGGWFFYDTIFGNIDVFNDISNFDY